ncbi:aminopeptidase N [Dendroctonus ponderosae]|uniref:aminopeptidase N n=1 Tax=Dendroctonus ponderosae TaxID=77166 RepID=UPI002034D04F|nr:aminopeptidase N [Dendroctonus ponderosae]
MHFSKILLVCLVAFVCSSVADDEDYRLPYNYILYHYDIDLVIPAESFTETSSNYNGSVAITFQVIESTNTVKLHASASNIVLEEIRLDDKEPTFKNVSSVTNILTLEFASDLIPEQNYTLNINFTAQLLSGGGFYKVSYTDHENTIRYTATTQFQATSARNAFPCFDEPVYKATFAYNLTYPAELNAWTNTPSIANNTLDDGLVKTQFGVSPRMSVYLVAFTISRYTCSEGDLEGTSEFQHRVCSRLDKEDARQWALEVTPKVIYHLNSYTSFNYTSAMSKLDQMAVPGKSGAMENWGLVIYGESTLLFNSTLQTSATKQSIAGIISHELAHMWFGNLLTCRWWSETFLNEGFASLFQYYTTHYAVPEFEMEKQFVVRTLQYVLGIEAYTGVPALRSNASTPSEISGKFGTYTYNKGASVLRMIEHILGRETFKDGIRLYIASNAYQSVEPEDLWTALEDGASNNIPNLPVDISLSNVVDNWINKGGFPVVNVELANNIITMSQERFLYSGSDDEDSTWYIPITYTRSSSNDFNEDTSPRGWVTPSANFSLTAFSASEWIVVNNQETGFYRVNYDSTLRENLASALKQDNFSGIHVTNRAQWVDDSYALARAGYLTFGQVLSNVEFLENETEYFTWYPAATLFNYLLQRTGTSQLLGARLTSHLLSLLETAVSTYALDELDESQHVNTLTSILINTYACKYGHTTCTNAAKTLFRTYKSSSDLSSRPNINIRSLVYCNAIRYSDNITGDWQFLYEKYQDSALSGDSSYIWTALGCANDTDVLKAFLSKVLENDDVITSSLYGSVFSTIYVAGEVGLDTVLDFFSDNYAAILEVYSNAGSVLTGLSSYITKTSQIEKLEALLATVGTDSTLAAPIQTALNTANENQAIIEAHRASLHEYFGLDTTSTPSTTSTTTTTTAAPDGNDEENGDDEEEVEGDDSAEVDSATTLSRTGLVGLVVIGLINSVYFGL